MKIIKTTLEFVSMMIIGYGIGITVGQLIIYLTKV